MWLIFEPQICSTRFAMNFLFIIFTTEMKVPFCVKLFNHLLTKYSSVWVETCRVSSKILLGFFHKISTRNSFWKMFQKLLTLQGAPLSRFPKFFLRFSNFIMSSYYAKKFWKHLQKYLHMSFVSSQAAKSKKKNTKKDIRKKSQDVLFLVKTSFPILFSLYLRLIRLIPWVFRFEIFIRNFL